MFGLSLGEIMLLLIVGIVVVGPKNLPVMMRTAGQWVSKLRRLSSDLRSQSGIDDLIRHEGLEKEIHELRSLSRMNVVESLIAPAALQPMTRPLSPAANALPRNVPQVRNFVDDADRIQPLREREYPLTGCDAAGALADDVAIYHHAPLEVEPAPPTIDERPAEAAGPAEGGAELVTAPPHSPGVELASPSEGAPA